MIEMLSFFHIVRLVGVHELESHLAEIAVAKRLISLLNCEVYELTLKIRVFAGRLGRKGNDDINNDVRWVTTIDARASGPGFRLCVGGSGRLRPHFPDHRPQLAGITASNQRIIAQRGILAAKAI